MQCRRVTGCLDDFIAGRLTGDDRRAIELHLEACPRCRDDLRTYRDTIALVRGAFAGGDEGPRPDDARTRADAVLAAWRAARAARGIRGAGEAPVQENASSDPSASVQ
jgi:anti-sigma factor RsiW